MNNRKSFHRLLIMVFATFLISGVYALPYTVTNVNDSGAGSLREAINVTNALFGLDQIFFDIPGAGPHEIVLQSPLPFITDFTAIAGYSQPGTIKPGTSSPAELKIAINGAAAGSGAVGLSLGGLCFVSGLAIYNFDSAINLAGDLNQVYGCHIGLDASGMVPMGNAIDGILVTGSNNTIGGLLDEERNVIVGNNNGITIFPNATDNMVQGNYIGTNATGNNTITNNGFDGISVGSGYNDIINNVVVGHESNNVLISWWFDESPFPTNNVVTDNQMGHHADGSFSSFTNNCQGVSINMASNTTVKDNIIFGNGCHGILIDGDAATGNLISQNSIYGNNELSINLGANGP